MPFSQTKSYILIFLAAFFCFYACQLQDEIVSTDQNIKLGFLRDTVKFDTILTQTKSQTRRLTVYNTNKNAVIIRNIRLATPQSPFSLVINGEVSNEKSNLRLLGGDSILILVTAKLPEKNQNLPSLVRDSILFETNGNQQHVKLWAWGQDVKRISKSVISTPVVWDGTRPYFVSDTLRIVTGGSLRLTEGTTVYMSPNATFLVQGKIMMQGNAEKPVLFTGTRNDEGYQNLAGQWNGIVFTQDSKGAELVYAQLRNANFGLYVGIPDNDTLPDVTIRNSVIENMLVTGIIAFNSDILIQNTLISNCLDKTFDARYGGNYTLQHCTLANYRGTIEKQPSIRLQNFLTYTTNSGAERTDEAPLFVRLENSIVWGDLEDEIEVTNKATIASRLVFRNNLLRTAKPNEHGTNNQNSNAFNFPLFENIGKQKFGLQAKSPAIDAGLNLGIANDIKGKARDAKPDMGAYEK